MGRLLLPKSDFVLLQVILEGERCARSDNRYKKIPRLCGFDQMFWPEDWVLIIEIRKHIGKYGIYNIHKQACHVGSKVYYVVNNTQKCDLSTAK